MKEGPCDQSFGIHVAEFCSFPGSVVDHARQLSQRLEEEGRPRKRAKVGSLDKVHGLLQRFGTLPLDSMDPASALREVKALVDSLDQAAEQDAVLQEMLETGTVL